MNKQFLRTSAAVLIAAVLAGSGGYYLGMQAGLEEPRNIVITNVSDADAPEGVDFGLFWEVWNKLKGEHIGGGELDNTNLLYGAIKGLTEAVGDPNTVFFPPEESKKFNEDIRGNFSGIGAEIGVRDGRLVIIAPLEDTPAQRAGLLPGDRIIQIDGEPTDGITVEEAVKLIRGERGTDVVLTILREGWDNTRNFTITRANITVPTVEWEMIEGNIVHLRLFSFSGSTPLDFQQAMVSALLAGGDGLVLDLRGNPGGFLDVAVRLSGFFLDRSEVVVIERFTSGNETILRARGSGALKDFPAVILINEGSASASEILAGALRVHNGAVIVGQQSFGKGTVQELQDLSNGSTLKVTVANWLLPNGDLIEGNGLVPDVPVEITPEDIEAGRDPQLQRAIEILKEQLATQN